jgi:hypothetical protein
MLRRYTGSFSRKRRRSCCLIVLLALIVAAQSCTVADKTATSKSSAEVSQSASLPHGKPLSQNEIGALSPVLEAAILFVRPGFATIRLL